MTILDCAGCGRPTRSRDSRAADHPGALVRVAAGRCQACYRTYSAPPPPPTRPTPARKPARRVGIDELPLAPPDDHPLAWQDEAICRQVDTEIFFPDKGGSPRDAQRVCNGDDQRPPCPVRDQCLQYALDGHERYGIWGGLTERQRRPLMRGAA